MATKYEKLRWDLYLIKKKIIFAFGFKTGLIRGYDIEFIENLRKVYYGYLPISIILLDVEGCINKCYGRALLAAFGCGDDYFEHVDADVDSITFKVKNIDVIRNQLGYLPPHYGNHSFIERTMKDGSVWVYDTSCGLVFEKHLYYLLNNPKVTKRHPKSEVTDYIEYQDIVDNNRVGAINEDKYLLPTALPILEEKVRSGNDIYKDALLAEIEWYKKHIDYDGICKEVEEEKKNRYRKMGGY